MASLTTGAQSGRTHLYQWLLTTADHTGEAGNNPGASDRTIQVYGTWGGASLTVEGSNDGTNWATLHDPTGEELVFTTDGIAVILENPLYIRPRLSVVGAGASVNAKLLSRSH
jgi:hypothetical protein